NSIILIAAGTTNGLTLWVNVNNIGGTLGVTAITYARLSIDFPGGTLPGSLSANNTWTGNNYFRSGIPWVDPIAFGADPTGVADSSSAFASAVAALGAGGGILKVSKGTYKLLTGVTVTSCIRIIGDGALATILTAGGANTTVVTLNAQRATLEHIGVL